MSIRVLIVDDHAVVRSGLRLLLDAEEDIEPVGEAGNARDAVFQARALKPDVILLDIVMPEQTGLDALPQLMHENPGAKVLVLSMQDEPRDVRAGVRGGRERLRPEGGSRHGGRRGRARGRGGRPLRQSRARRTPGGRRCGGGAARGGGSALRPRARGAAPARARPHEPGDREAALHPVRTAETHRAHIMQKLRLQTRADLVAYALERGVLEAE